MTTTFLPLVANGVVTLEPELVNLVTYNIGYDANAWTMAPDERTLRIGRLFRECSVDVIALQEVMFTGDRIETDTFQRFFPEWHWFAVPHNTRNHYCNMILTTYPIVEGSERTHTIVSAAGRNDRINLSVQIETPSGMLRVYDIHTRFEEPDSGTLQILRWVRDVAEREPDVPYVVMGDFNMRRTPIMEVAEDMGLQLAATTVGRIDHVLAHGAAIVDELTISRPNVPGEHDPVFATVSL